MSDSVFLYGITTCDTVRKARRWLVERGISFHYHDLRRDGLSKAELLVWLNAVGWEKLINRSGTTFRTLPESQKLVGSEAEAITLMLAHPTIIKRPVLVRGTTLTLGFKPMLYETAFSDSA